MPGSDTGTRVFSGGDRGATLAAMDRDQVLLVDADGARSARVAEALRSAGLHVVVEADPAVAEGALAEPGIRYLMVDVARAAMDLPALRRALRAGATLPPDSLEAAERRHIARMLEHTGGNKRRAALLLGISRSTLLNKIRRYGL